MFSRNKGPREPSPVEKRSAPSIVSNDLRIIGDLHSEGEIQVDGAVDGDIHSHTLLVGETAVIKGEIVAAVVQVHGTIHGQIKGQAVSLARTAHVVGDILHETLSIENGAFLEGHCKRMEERKAPEPVEEKSGLTTEDDFANSLGREAATGIS